MLIFGGKDSSSQNLPSAAAFLPTATRLCSTISAWIVALAFQHVSEKLYLPDMERAMGNRDEDPMANTEVVCRRWNPVEVGFIQRGNEVRTFSPDFLNPFHYVGH